MRTPQNLLKYLIGLLMVITFRLVPHPPNVEPIMATMMPFSKKWGWASGMLFALLAIISFDLITGTFGSWTLITAGTYAALGVAAGLFLKNRESNLRHYVIFAVAGTLVYDAITGIGMGVFMFHMPLMTTLTGQIPFTIYHLTGNIVLASVVSPLLYKWVIANPKLETAYINQRIALAAGLTLK